MIITKYGSDPVGVDTASPGYYQARTDVDRKLRNHIRQIQALGFDITLTKAA